MNKQNEKLKVKGEKYKISATDFEGITLVALVITIIVLIILAAVSINAVLNDGLIENAKEAKKLSEVAQDKEAIELVLLEWEVEKVKGTKTLGQLLNENFTDVLDNGDGSYRIPTASGELYIVKANGELKTLFTGEVVDSGQCGDTLYWKLYEDGTLHIYGTGAMYDYVKFTQAAPWHKYRKEPYINEDQTKILNPDGTEYRETTSYFADNPNKYYVENIVIDEGVTYLGNWAFYRVCVNSLTIPEGVESTGYFCIRYSPTLKAVNLPNSLKTLGDFGISRNGVLTTVNFGNGLERIGTGGLSVNPMLEAAIFPDTLVSINEQLNETYSEVDYSAIGLLADCNSLKTISLGSVANIPQRTCLNNSSLENVIIPNTVSSIGAYAFNGCTSLKNVVFEENSVCTEVRKKFIF